MNAEQANIPVQRQRVAASRRRLASGRAGVLALLMAALLAGPMGVAQAQLIDHIAPRYENQKLDIQEQLGETIPSNLVFTNSEGERVELSDYLDRGKPVVLNLIYFGCPMLCHLATQGLVNVLKDLEWTAGEKFTVLTVSFDPSEGPQIASTYKAASLEAYGRPEAARGWDFLTGDADNIAALTQAVGFEYEWVEERGEFAHPAALIVVTPDGRISRYMAGIQHEPTTLRRSLVEASNGQIGSFVDQVLWRCMAYDPDAGAYVLAAWTVLRLGGLLTVIALVAVLGSLWFLDSRRKKTAALP